MKQKGSGNFTTNAKGEEKPTNWKEGRNLLLAISPKCQQLDLERLKARDILVMSEWSRNSLLGLEDLTKHEIMKIIETAESFAQQEQKQSSDKGILRGYRIINLFMEPSTRDNVFGIPEIAAKSLGADVISISGEASSLTKGENLKDTALNVKALGADAIVIRHFVSWFAIASF